MFSNRRNTDHGQAGTDPEGHAPPDPDRQGQQRRQDRQRLPGQEVAMESATSERRGTFPADWGPPPANPAAVRGWIQGNVVKGIRRAHAGERVEWLAPELRSKRSPKAALLKLDYR